MNQNIFPPPKKPRLDIQYGGSSQIPATHNQLEGTQAMDLGDDWDDDNLFIEAADEFDKLIALSQAVPTSNVIIHPTGHQQNSEVKPFPTKLSTLHFPDSPKSSKTSYPHPGSASGSKLFQKSKSFNLDQIANNFENRNNVLCSNGVNVISETSIKQSELYKTKCGENEILQKQIKNLTTNLHDSKCRLRQAMLEKDKEKTLLKEEMNQKMEELKAELDRLNTELMFQKNHITSTEFRTKELKKVRLKEPESPNSPSIGPSAWRMVDDLNSSFSRAKTSPCPPPADKMKSPGQSPRNTGVDVRSATPVVEVESHVGSTLNNLVGERLLQLRHCGEAISNNSVVTIFGSDLVQLVSCQSFLTSKAKHLMLNILTNSHRLLSSELAHLRQLSENEDKGESVKRDHILSKSCFNILPGGIHYDLLQSKKLFDSEEGLELRKCVQLIAILCSLSSYALSVVLNVPVSDLVRDNAVVSKLESVSTNTNETDIPTHIDILQSLKLLVTEISNQFRTKSYNGVLLSIAHLILQIFHQKVTIPENTLDLISSIVREIILSRPAPAVLELCVVVMTESTYSPTVQRNLCGHAEMSSCRSSIVSSSDIIHSFTPRSCAIRVLCTCLELIQPTATLVRAYLEWTLRLVALGKSQTVRDSNSVPCDCTTEVYHLFLVMGWTAVRKLCKEFSAEQSPVVKHQIKTCVELAYQILYKVKQDKHLQFLQREGIYEALVLRLKTSNLNITLSDKLKQSLTLDNTSDKPLAPQSGSGDSRKSTGLRSVICGDHLNEEFNDLDI
ncbi:hypothetical protein M8J77_020009 [Diaphorina citri]|nr:hypothetical protein M8J77_020009 [Diaphorina citri]